MALIPVSDPYRRRAETSQPGCKHVALVQMFASVGEQASKKASHPQDPPSVRGGGGVARRFRLTEEAFGRLVGRLGLRPHAERPIARDAPSCARRHCRSGPRAPGFAQGPPSSLRRRSLRPDHRLAIAGLQFQPALARRRRGLYFVGLGERREQRLGLSDLRHFRRRRKAFERRREDVVRVDGAGGGLIEFRQRQRRPQAEAARACRFATAMAVWRILRHGAGSRDRAEPGCRRARDAVQPRTSDGRCARTSPARRRECVSARSASPARASASASAILMSPSTTRTFRSRSSPAPRRISSSPPPGAPLSAVAKPWRKIPNARQCGKSCSRVSRESSAEFSAEAEGRRASFRIWPCALLRLRAWRYGRGRAIRAPAAGGEGNRAIDVTQRP